MKRKCHRLLVPRNVCTLDFVAKGKRKGYAFSLMEYEHKGKEVTFETVRGEQLFIDVDRRGRVLSIELLDAPGARKPCMRSSCLRKGK
jgi:hypothetical protein